jgi:hypothetical protein
MPGFSRVQTLEKRLAEPIQIRYLHANRRERPEGVTLLDARDNESVSDRLLW